MGHLKKAQARGPGATHAPKPYFLKNKSQARGPGATHAPKLYF